MNVAVLGANGYVGQHIIYYLVEQKGYHVTGFDLQDSYIGSHKISYHRLDITDRAQFDEVDMEFDAVYFFSALTGTEVAFDRYVHFIRVNEIGLLNLLDKIRHCDKKAKVIFPSTRLVYKGVEGAALNEDAEKEFKTLYASSKYNGELYLEMYRNMYGIDYNVFRVSVPYGNELHTKMSYGTLSFFIQRALDKDPIILYGDGTLQRTFTHIMDVCRQMIEVSEMPGSGGLCFNVDGETYSLRDVAEVVAKKYDATIEYIEWPGNSWKLESGHTVFDCSRIRSFLPQTLAHNLKDWVNN